MSDMSLPKEQDEPLPDTSHRPQSELEKISDLVHGTREPEPEAERAEPEPETAPEPVEAEPETDTPAKLAEARGVTVEDVYGLQIPIDGLDEPVTLGQLKDKFLETQETDIVSAKERLEWDDAKAKAENEIMLARAQLQKIVELIGPDKISQDVVDQLSRDQTSTMQREQNLMLRSIPEWSDEGRFVQDRAKMVDHIAPYGYTAHDLARITDHRLVKYIRDNMALADRYERAMKFKPVQKQAPKASAPKGTRTETTKASALASKAKQTGRREDINKAVSALLEG